MCACHGPQSSPSLLKSLQPLLGLSCHGISTCLDSGRHVDIGLSVRFGGRLPVVGPESDGGIGLFVGVRAFLQLLEPARRRSVSDYAVPVAYPQARGIRTCACAAFPDDAQPG